MKTTFEDIKIVEAQLKPCPFCGSEVKIVIYDEEGNPKKNAKKYLENPYSGISFGVVHKNTKCYFTPCDEYEVVSTFDTLEELVKEWNKRF